MSREELRFRIKPKFEIKSGQPPSLDQDVREGILALETEAAIHPMEKVLILATLLNLKPASEFTISNEDEGAFRSAAARTESILKKFGLSFEVSDIIKEGQVYQREYFIAGTPEAATTLKRLLRGDVEDSPQRQIEIGNALGFPATAVRAWNQKRFEGLDSLASEAEVWRDFGTELGEFIFFTPSKTYWQDEKKWLRGVVDQVRSASETIYEQALKT